MIDVQIARRRQNWYLASLSLGDEPDRRIALRCECGDERCPELVHIRADEFRDVVYCHRGFVSAHPRQPARRRTETAPRPRPSRAPAGSALRRASAGSRRE